MERYPIDTIDPLRIFPQLGELPTPPKELFLRGSVEKTHGTKLLAVVGARKCTSYGKSMCRDIIAGLRGYPITIVSGLALGIDSVAHIAALENNIPTISFPGSGLGWNVLYPAQHRGLAESILEHGGALLSEYTSDMRAAYWSFPQRNRLVAGISDMTIVIEAERKSGALITARLATEYNKIVGVLPGNVTSPSSKGTNWLLRLGATPITESSDILLELGLTSGENKTLPFDLLNAQEEKVFAYLSEPRTKDDVMYALSLDPSEANILFSTLEIKGVIKETMGMIERIA